MHRLPTTSSLSTLGLTVRRSDATAVVSLSGELCFESIAEVRDVFARICGKDQSPTELVVDLREVSLLDSSGLSLLIDVREQARRYGCALCVVATPGTHPRHVLDITLLSSALAVRDTLADAASDERGPENPLPHPRRRRDEHTD